MPLNKETKPITTNMTRYTLHKQLMKIWLYIEPSHKPIKRTLYQNT